MSALDECIIMVSSIEREDHYYSTRAIKDLASLRSDLIRLQKAVDEAREAARAGLDYFSDDYDDIPYDFKKLSKWLAVNPKEEK